MSTEIVLKTDPDLLTDLEIIALNEPGKGAALKRLIQRSGMTQGDVAEKIGYDNRETGRTTINMWTAESRWPNPRMLRKTLCALNIDRKILLDKFGIQLGTEATPPAVSRELAVTLRNELMFEFDEFERMDLILNSTWEHTVLFQSFKSFDDTRAAQFIKEVRAEHLEEKRLRSSEQARNVTPKVQDWSAGKGLYSSDVSPTPGQSDTTIGSEGTTQHNTPTRVLDNDGTTNSGDQK